MNPSITPEKWAAIRALCEGETPSLELAAVASGIEPAILAARCAVMKKRQEDDGGGNSSFG